MHKDEKHTTPLRRRLTALAVAGVAAVSLGAAGGSALSSASIRFPHCAPAPVAHGVRPDVHCPPPG
jgi:hypothetical protein